MSFALLLLPDFLLIAGGALLKRAGGFGAAFWPGLERLVYFVLFPALLFLTTATSELAGFGLLPLAAALILALLAAFAGIAFVRAADRQGREP